MNSVIFQTAARALLPLLLLFSIVILIRGHNAPGGGFVGGLLAASAFTTYAMAFGTPAVRRMLHVQLHMIIGLGLLLAFASGVPGLIGGSFLQAYDKWLVLETPGLGQLKIGTPLFFDIGVYFAVMGVCLMMIFELAEAEPERRDAGSPEGPAGRGGTSGPSRKPKIELNPGGETVATARIELSRKGA
ncbi:MAG: Na+/H+ antiporter subunit B [Planctomycetota bacterium]